MNDKLLTVDQVSEYLGVHRDTVYAMIRSGRLPALQLGGRKASWRISESDLTAFIAARKSAGNRPSGSTSSFEADQARDRAEFDKEQAQELTDFQGRQEHRRASFDAGQERDRQARTRVDSDGHGAPPATEDPEVIQKK